MDDRGFLATDDLQALVDTLARHRYRVIGPTVRDQAIQYDDLADVAALPQGWRQQQVPGRYTLLQSDSPRRFAWANGPQALKPLLFTPTETLWTARRETDGHLRFVAETRTEPALAVIGVRACDLAALRLQDKHFIGQQPDPGYRQRRAGLFVVAVHCTHPAETCFCASTGDGPRANEGFDIALSETDRGYLVEPGSASGRAICRELPLTQADPAERVAADQEIDSAAARQQRVIPTGDLSNRLFDSLNNPHWQNIAERCMACSNCTSVCPTCFCHRHADRPALGGGHSEHIREWDSCFTAGHGYLHGYHIRPDTQHRYQQWLTHKFGSWHQQYGRSGCVGCGRCITWCPVGIDLTEEIAVLTDAKPAPEAAL